MNTKKRPDCSIDDCDKPHLARGWCKAHYMRWKRHGDPLVQRNATPMPDKGCSVEGCPRAHKARGYCEAHYLRVVKTGSPGLVEVQEKVARPDACTFDGCDKPVRARLLCGGHYRQHRDGEQLRALEQYGPRGEGTVNGDGYRIISVQGKAWLEHRYLADLALREHHGRLLLSHEEIHHVNGDRLDNRIAGPFHLDEKGRWRSGNLEVWSTRQPKGQAIADKLEYAREILALYGDTRPAAPETCQRPESVPSGKCGLCEVCLDVPASERDTWPAAQETDPSNITILPDERIKATAVRDKPFVPTVDPWPVAQEILAPYGR